ncbi:hypothetical protein QCA50_005018 [Cerrena zonata]|uniref:Uncharacterized protein n=1 Tax=Cerrena zonata TaxID=2478898 RepID=A0AAW0GIK8_9APHY
MAVSLDPSKMQLYSHIISVVHSRRRFLISSIMDAFLILNVSISPSFPLSLPSCPLFPPHTATLGESLLPHFMLIPGLHRHNVVWFSNPSLIIPHLHKRIR